MRSMVLIALWAIPALLALGACQDIVGVQPVVPAPEDPVDPVEPDACAETGDSDNDGVCDDADLCPEGDDKRDSDSDAVPDACDVCPDGDDTSDGDDDDTPDACDPCPLDPLDDSDSDGSCDSDDLCPGGDDTQDRDRDTIPDACDPCPAGPCGSSCKDILDSGTGDTDGVYLIDPDGDGPAPSLSVFCDMDFLGGGWTAVFNLMALPSSDDQSVVLFDALTKNADMTEPVTPDSSSGAVRTSNLPLERYREVVYGWAPSADENVSRWGYYTRSGLTGECYLDGYCGPNQAVAEFEIQPAGTRRTIYTGSDPTYPHVGLGFSGQIIVWGYDRNHSPNGGWGNWFDSNPCCNAGNTDEVTRPGWRYVIYVR